MADDTSVQIRFGASTDEALAGIEAIRAALGGLADPLKDINGQMAIFRLQQAQQRVLLNAEASQYQITQNEKYTLLEAETKKEYEAELALLGQKLALDDLSLEQKQKVLDKMTALEIKYNTDMIRLDAQAIAQQQQMWTSSLSTIENAFNSQLRGLLAGTTSWSTAFKNILGDIIIKFIETCEQMVAKWIAAELAQTTATTSGAAARVAAEQGAASSGILANAASALQAIMTDAAQAFAGVFAFLAPVMGPAAAGPAAAAQATVAYLGQRVTETVLTSINRYANGGPDNGTGTTTDYTISINDLQAGCTTVAVVVAWFGNSTDVTACQIYPSTTYIGGTFQQASGASDVWRCSGLTQSSPGLITIPQSASGTFIYGGTPSDQSIVRCIGDLRNRALRVVFYPFILMTAGGEPWRGQIAYNGTDISSAATTAIDNFLGGAAVSDFTQDNVNLTVAYSGSPTDYTYRRMILHYANLCCVAGGVDLFLLGSELRGLEVVRGPAWTQAGSVSGGTTTWDYPFVAGLVQLASDVRTVFNTAGLSKDTVNLHNLIAYSADWSVWMGFQHPGENGQWPHLDQLYASPNIDLVSFDNYLPLSDWTTSGGGLDAQNWNVPAPFAFVDDGRVVDAPTSTADYGSVASPAATTEDCGSVAATWPPSASAFNGLGLSGPPTIYSIPYLQANIEGGEKFNWFYDDGSNGGPGLDPNGSDLIVSLPQGDRLAQARNQYDLGQQLLANKQLRWWWNNFHYAIYDTGSGWAPQGLPTEWVPQSKSITFTEYGFPSCDKGTNQPNVFFSPASVESFTPFWSIWDPSAIGTSGYPASGLFAPRRDDLIYLLALQAVYEYWQVNNSISETGVLMIQPAFMSVWNWDARPFPYFPQLSSVWGDAGNWPAGDWLQGKGPYVAPPTPDNPPAPGPYLTFPVIDTLGWSIKLSPKFSTGEAVHASGREVRASRYLAPLWSVELDYDVLRLAAPYEELQAIIGFFEDCQGENTSFYFEPPTLSPLTGQIIGGGDGATTTFALTVTMGGASITPASVSVLKLYLNGLAQPSSAYAVNAISPGPSVTFVSPPEAGVAVSADFAWFLLCRFDDDNADAEEFMSQLYALQSLKLRSVRG